MDKYIETLQEWIKSGQKVAIARVIKTWGSSPRPIGSVMYVNESGQMLGSVSGGCVEGDVVKAADKAIKERQSLLLEFGVSDEEAWTAGLSCGGKIEVFVQPMNFEKGSVWSGLLDRQEENSPAILISQLEDERTNSLLSDTGFLGGAEVYQELINMAEEAYQQRANRVVSYDGKSFFIHIFPRKSVLLMIGAAHITVDLVTLANLYGFETVVIDPRGYFTRKTTFQNPPSQLLEAYPSEVLGDFTLDAYTYSAILSHDPKIDDNALELLLPSNVAYIGALGSKKTHAKRIKRLREKGFSEEQIERIQAPIGLNINARTAREIALSIMGQIIEVQNRNAR